MVKALRGSDGGLTFAESQAQFVLWCAFKAPLMLGVDWANLATLKTEHPEYFALITNPELIALDQDVSPQATLRSQVASRAQRRAGACPCSGLNRFSSATRSHRRPCGAISRHQAISDRSEGPA